MIDIDDVIMGWLTLSALCGLSCAMSYFLLYEAPPVSAIGSILGIFLIYVCTKDELNSKIRWFNYKVYYYD